MQVKPVFDPSLKKLHMFQFAKKSLPSGSETEIKNGDARCALAKHSSIDSIAPLSSTSINAGKFSTSVDQVPLDSIQICPCFHDLPRFSTQLPCPALGIPAPQELQLATSWKAIQNGEERMAQLSHLEILSIETTNLTILAQMA